MSVVSKGCSIARRPHFRPRSPIFPAHARILFVAKSSTTPGFWSLIRCFDRPSARSSRGRSPIALTALLPATIARPRPTRKTGRCTTTTSSARATTRPRRPSAGTTPAGSWRSGGSPPRARARRSASSTPRPSSSTATSTSARPPTRRSTSSRPTARSAGPTATRIAGRRPSSPDARIPRTPAFQSSAEGILGSALVTDDTVFFGDIGGWIYALDRATGAERWKLNTRGQATSPAPTR